MLAEPPPTYHHGRPTCDGSVGLTAINPTARHPSGENIWKNLRILKFFTGTPIVEGKLDDWIALLYDKPTGLALTKFMPGFISAETAIMTDDKGQTSFLLWAKCER